MKDFTERGEKAENIFGDGQAINFLSNNSAGKVVENAHLQRRSCSANAAQNRSENFLLAAQPDQIFVKLLPFLERVSLAAGEHLSQNGDRIKFLYFPETAVVADFQMLEDGRTVEIAMIGREGISGLVPFLSAAAAANWTQVVVAGTALKINAEVLRREFNYSFKLQSEMFEYLNNYLNQISQRMICSTFHSAEQRFCGWLAMLAKRGEKSSLRLTQEQIARSLGVHRPTVSSVAKKLQREQILDYRRGSISIVNQPSLENLACECHQLIDAQDQPN